MPKSRNRKDHKRKVNEYKRQNEITRKKVKEQAIKEYIEKIQMEQQTNKVQQNSEMVSGEDINIDLDVNLDNDGLNDAQIIDIPTIEVTEQPTDK